MIIGAGLHGLSAGLHLPRAGLEPLILEKDYPGRMPLCECRWRTRTGQRSSSALVRRSDATLAYDGRSGRRRLRLQTQDLAQALGLTLFERRRGRLEPTVAAQVLYAAVERSFIGLDKSSRRPRTIAPSNRAHCELPQCPPSRWASSLKPSSFQCINFDEPRPLRRRASDGPIAWVQFRRPARVPRLLGKGGKTEGAAVTRKYGVGEHGIATASRVL